MSKRYEDPDFMEVAMAMGHICAFIVLLSLGGLALYGYFALLFSADIPFFSLDFMLWWVAVTLAYLLLLLFLACIFGYAIAILSYVFGFGITAICWVIRWIVQKIRHLG